MVSVDVFLPRRSSALPEWHKNWLFRMRPMISASLIRSHTMPDVVGVSVEYWGVSMHAFFRIEAFFSCDRFGWRGPTLLNRAYSQVATSQ